MRCFLIGLFLLAAPTSAAAQTHTVIAANGAAAPGGGNYNLFNTRGPAANAAGQVTFYASTASPGGGGAFLYSGGSVTALARTGQAAPGGVGTYGTFSLSNEPAPAIDAGGTVAFRASLTGGTSDLGIFTRSGTTTTTIVLTGQTIPGAGTIQDTLVVGGIANGTVAFYGNLPEVVLDNGPVDGIFRGNGTTTTAVAVVGQTAPGSGGATYAFGNTDPQINAAGQVTHVWAMENGTADSGVYRDTGGTSVPIAISGQAAAGGLGTIASFSIDRAYINTGGQVAFQANLTGGTAATGIFRGDGTVLTTIAAQGQPAPGTAFSFGGIIATPVLNDAGQVAFHAFLGAGQTNQAVYRGDGSTLTLIATTGAVAPGTGITFRELSFDSVQLNAAGVVAFRGALTLGGTVTIDNDRGLWVGTSTADLILLAREGDVINVNGVNKTLREVSAQFALTDDGVAWRAVFTDNSTAILYTTITPVPEPAAVLGVATLALVAVRRRRGSREV